MTIENIGLFGGTFDPIHNGHIIPIEQAIKQMGLSGVQLMPAHIPPHKAQTHCLPEHREAMVSLVCEKSDIFSLNSQELKKTSASYTVETLKNLRANITKNSNIYFFIGMDSLLNFTQWYKWQEILTLCHLVVMARPGYSVKNIPSEIKNICFQADDKQKLTSITQNCSTGCVIILPPVLQDISSTHIRKLIKTNLPFENLVPKAVADYINKHQLYR